MEEEGGGENMGEKGRERQEIIGGWGRELDRGEGEFFLTQVDFSNASVEKIFKGHLLTCWEKVTHLIAESAALESVC